MVSRHVSPSRRLSRELGSVNLDAAFEAVSDKIKKATLAAAKELDRLGIRHVLCGGIAVGAHGYPRATKDVDFLVGEEAFEHHGSIVTLRAPFEVEGVAVDSVPIPKGGEFLAEEFDRAKAESPVPVVSAEGLVYMKLLAGRRRDQLDLIELVKAGLDTKAARRYLKKHAPTLGSAFEKIVQTAESGQEL